MIGKMERHNLMRYWLDPDKLTLLGGNFLGEGAFGQFHAGVLRDQTCLLNLKVRF